MRSFGPEAEVTLEGLPGPSLRRLIRMSAVFFWNSVKTFPSGNTLVCRDPELCATGPCMNSSDTPLRPAPTRSVQFHLPRMMATAIVSPKPSAKNADGTSNIALFALCLLKMFLN